MRVPEITISDTVISKLEEKHHIEIELVMQGVLNATEWRKEEGRYHSDTRTDAGKRIHVVVDRRAEEWQIVTAWWI